VFERDPNFVGVRQELARVYINLGRCPKPSRRYSTRLINLSLCCVGARYTYAKCGRRAEARAELNRLLGLARAGEYVSHYSLAIIQAGSETMTKRSLSWRKRTSSVPQQYSS